MTLRITTLSENTAGKRGLLGEWGLSILLETGDSNILFDCGQTISTVHNAEKLNIDLTKVNKIVLSHGHYDHTGGLRDVLGKMKKEVEIIAHPNIWQAKYAWREGESSRYIGIPFERRELENLGAHFNLAKEPTKITDDLTTTGEIPMLTDFEQLDECMFVREDSNWQPDKLFDDQALVIKDEAGLIVISGCAHRGIINTLYRAMQLTGIKKIHAVIGGSHLVDAPEEILKRTIYALRMLEIPTIGLCHCTGMTAASLMAREFGNNFIFNKTGTVIEIT